MIKTLEASKNIPQKSVQDQKKVLKSPHNFQSLIKLIKLQCIALTKIIRSSDQMALSLRLAQTY